MNQLTPLLSASNHSQELPESWSQLLLEGFVGEEDEPGLSHIHQAKKLENLEQQFQNQTSNTCVQFQGTNNCWSHPMMSHSSPKSCVTNNMFDYSHKSECNSNSTGRAAKKARIQPSSAQSTFKVSKEKLGGRITALHQIVSPFGKTDTASVLLEAIGYIRFLQSQVEALSLPYLGSASRNMLNQHVNGEKNCFFPEDPGQEIISKQKNEKIQKKQSAHDYPTVPISNQFQPSSPLPTQK